MADLSIEQDEEVGMVFTMKVTEGKAKSAVQRLRSHLVGSTKRPVSDQPPSGVPQMEGSTGALPNLKALVTKGHIIGD